MDLDAAIAIIGAIVAIAGAVTAWRQAGDTAKKNELESLRAIVEANQREAADEQQRNADLVARLREANDRIIALEVDRQETRRQLSETLDELAAMRAELSSACQANQELVARVAALEKERDALLRRIDTLEAERKEQAEELQKLRRRSFK